MVRVVASQFAWLTPLNEEIARLVATSSPSDPNHGFDVISGAAYFDDGNSSFNAQTTVQQIEAAEMAELTGKFAQQLQTFMASKASWEKQLNQRIPVVMYEGGQGLSNLAGGSSPWYAAYVAAQTDPGQYALTATFLNELADAGVQGLEYFIFMEIPNPWGEYGSMQYLGEPSSLTPSIRRAVDFINSPSLAAGGVPGIDTAGTAANFTVTAGLDPMAAASTLGIPARSTSPAATPRPSCRPTTPSPPPTAGCTPSSSRSRPQASSRSPSPTRRTG